MRWFSLLLARFGTRTLMTIFGLLFVIDLLLPDPIPFVDELLLGAGTLLAARWRQQRAPNR
jgi:hypothetical protein